MYNETMIVSEVRDSKSTIHDEPYDEHYWTLIYYHGNVYISTFTYLYTESLTHLNTGTLTYWYTIIEED